MSLHRAANASPEALDLFTTDTMLMIEMGEVTEQDVLVALDRFGRSERDEGEPAFPTWARLEREYRNAKRDRLIAEAKRLALTNGRLPGEDMIAYNKRKFLEERANGEEPDLSFEKRVREIAKAKAMPAAMPQKPTAPPPESTAPAADTLKGE